jgi:hypothetical protein
MKMSPSELLRELHEGNQRLQRVLEDLRLLELRNWTMSDAERERLRQIDEEDQADREARLDDDWTRR